MENKTFYNEVLTDHNLHPGHKHALDDANMILEGVNPSCGDDIFLNLKFEDGVIKDGSFQGDGCAISQASADMMLDLIVGKTKEEAMNIIENYMNMIFEKDYDPEILEEAIAFYNTHKQANRIKCATLGWKGITQLIDESEKEETHGK